MCVTLAGISCFYCWYCVCVCVSIRPSVCLSLVSVRQKVHDVDTKRTCQTTPSLSLLTTFSPPYLTVLDLIGAFS